VDSRESDSGRVTGTDESRPEPLATHPLGPSLAIQLVCLTGALAFWFASLPMIDLQRLNDFGLAPALPAGIWMAYALLATTFAVNLLDREPNGLRAGLTLAGLVAMLHATPALAYGTLRYSWAWKHIGIVDYIQRNGVLDPTADFLAAYHNWPALFFSTAWLADRFGLDAIDLTTVVIHIPLMLNLAFLAILPRLYSRLTHDIRMVWVATAFFVVGNWVGQDYFSPQGVAFLMYLVTVTLCLGPLAKPYRQRRPGEPIVERYEQLIRWLTSAMPPPRATSPTARIAATITFMTIVVVMVATHQLTPLLLISTLAGLVLLRRISAAFLVFAATAEITWLFYFASPYTAAVLPELLAEFGNTAQSALDKMADLGQVSHGQFWVSAAARGLTGTIVVVALAGGLYRLLTGRRDGVAAWLVLAPLPLMVATSYGGEILFRVYFYALPGLCFFAAAPFGTAGSTTRTRAGVLLAAGLLLVLIPGFVLANNGKDRQYRFTPSEIDVATWLYANAPPQSLLVEGSRSYPSQFLNYEKFIYVPISEETAAVQREILDDPAAVLGRWLSQSEHGGFVILTRSQEASVEDIGIMPPGSFDRIEAALFASPRFILAKAGRDALVFTLHPDADKFPP
jgi:hypothetical protein